MLLCVSWLACTLYLQTNQNVSRAGFESVVLIAQLVRAEAHVWLSTCQLELNTGRWFESSSRHIFQFEKLQNNYSIFRVQKRQTLFNLKSKRLD